MTFSMAAREGVIAAFGEHVRPGSDQVNVNAECRAGLVAAFEAHVGFVDLQPRLQGEDSVFDQRVQFVAGSQVMVFQGQFHVVFGWFRV